MTVRFMFHRLSGWLVIGLAVVALSGCMLARSPASVSVIAPNVEMSLDEAWPQVDWSLLVQRPVTDQMRDSDRILVRVSRSRLQSWPEAAWLDSMPDMLQGLLIQSLEDSERFAAVGRAGGMRSRFGLVGEVRRFEAVDEGSGPLSVEVAFQASLVHQPTGRVMASSTFLHSIPAERNSLDGVIDAFSVAMAEVFHDLTAWVLASGEEASAELDNWRERSSERRSPRRGDD